MAFSFLGNSHAQLHYNRRSTVSNVVSGYNYNYIYYKFTPITLKGGSTNFIQLSELIVGLDSSRVDYTGAVASNPGGSSPGSEGPAQAIDNNVNTKWLDVNIKSLIITFPSQKISNMYTFTTANDVKERDPISWVFYGSNDGTTWTIIDTQTNYATTDVRFTQLEWFQYKPQPVVSLINPPSSGTTWSDSTGNGYNATINGTSTYSSANGGSLTTSNGGYFSTSYNINSSNFTISMVCTINPVSFWATVWANEIWNSSKGYFAVLTYSNGLTLMESGGNGSGTVLLGDSTARTALDFVYSGTTAGTTALIYKNGVALTSGITIGARGGYSTSGLYFGSRHTNGGTGSTDVCPLTLHMAKVYNVTLTAAQISSNYTANKVTYSII